MAAHTTRIRTAGERATRRYEKVRDSGLPQRRPAFASRRNAPVCVADHAELAPPGRYGTDGPRSKIQHTIVIAASHRSAPENAILWKMPKKDNLRHTWNRGRDRLAREYRALAILQKKYPDFVNAIDIASLARQFARVRNSLAQSPKFLCNQYVPEYSYSLASLPVRKTKFPLKSTSARE